MKQLLIIILFVGSINQSLAQIGEHFEVFEIDNELMLLKDDQVWWQNDTEETYLGKIRQIPDNSVIPKLKVRDELLDGLIKKFLSEVLATAKSTGKDSIFQDAFVLKSGITAVAYQYEQGASYEVQLGKKVVGSGNTEISEFETVGEVFNKLIEFFSKQSETIDYRLERTYQGRHIHYNIYEGSTSIRPFYICFHPTGYSDDRMDVVLNKLGLQNSAEFIEVLFGERQLKQINGRYTLRNNLQGLNSKDFLRFVNGGSNTTFSVETSRKTVENLQQARNRGDFGFIARYLERELRNPHADRKIFYIEPTDPIFVQDSVLEYWNGNQFSLISSRLLPENLTSYILPEVSHRIRTGNPTEIQSDSFSVVDEKHLSFRFENENYTVLSVSSNGMISYYYIIGWDQVADKTELINLLIQYGLPERSKVNLKQYRDQLALITSDNGTIQVEAWDPVNRKKVLLVDNIPADLQDDIRSELMIEAVLDQYIDNPKVMNLTYYGLDSLAENMIAIKFAYDQPLLLIAQDTEKVTKQLTGADYSDKESGFYEALVNDESIDSSLFYFEAGNMPFVRQSDGSVFSMSENVLVQLTTISDDQYSYSSFAGWMENIASEYSKFEESAVINYWQPNGSYVAYKYPEQNLEGLYSALKPELGFIAVENFSQFSDDSLFVNQLVTKIKKDAPIKIHGNRADQVWMTQIGNELYLNISGFDDMVFFSEDTTGIISADYSDLLKFLKRRVLSNLDIVIDQAAFIANQWLLNLKADDQFFLIKEAIIWKLTGNVTFETYLGNEPIVRKMSIEYGNVQQINTDAVDNVFISKGGGKWRFWKDGGDTFHAPAASFPEFLSSGQEQQLTNALRSMYLADSELSIKAIGITGKAGGYSIYNADDKSWMIFPRVGQGILSVLNTPEIPPATVDSLLSYTKGKAHSLDYYETSGTVFLIDNSSKHLLRLISYENPVIVNLANVEILLNPSDSTLFEKFLTEVSNPAYSELKGLQKMELNDNRIVMWELADAFRTLILPNVVDANSMVLTQKNSQKLIGEKSVLDRYFTFCAGTGSEAEVYVPESQKLYSFHHVAAKKWIVKWSDKAIAEIGLSADDFKFLMNTAEDINLKLVGKLYSYPPNTDLYYDAKGYYYRSGNWIIYGLTTFNSGKPLRYSYDKFYNTINNTGYFNPKSTVLADMFGTTDIDIVITKICDEVIRVGNPRQAVKNKWGFNDNQQKASLYGNSF